MTIAIILDPSADISAGLTGQPVPLPTVLDADGMPAPDIEADAVTAAVRALPDDAPELAIDWQEACDGV